MSDILTISIYLGTESPEILLNLAYKFKNIQDVFICESLICALTGVTLKIRNKIFTQKVIQFYEADFLQENLTNHVAILDYIKTIFSFAKSEFNLKINETILFRNKSEKWVVNNKEVDEFSEFTFSYQMMDYDFIKYQITALSNESYNSPSPYSKREIISFINQKIIQKNYSKEIYETIDNHSKEVNKYQRQEASERVISYAQKYLDIAYLEFAGYMMINQQLTPERTNTFRFSYINFDPTFPQLPRKLQLLNENFLPKYNDDIQEWILQDDSELLNDIYVTQSPFMKKEMILLYSGIIQENQEDKTRISIAVNAFLFKDKIRKNVVQLFSKQYQNASDFHHIFGGEIPWIDLFDNEEVYLDSVNDLFSAICRYSWNSWSSDRFCHPSFSFLTPLIAQKLDLEFDTSILEYINKNGEPVTKYFHTNHSHFLFIDKSVLMQFLKNEKYNLVWSKHISKYGDFGDYKGKLKPSYKDFLEYKFL